MKALTKHNKPVTLRQLNGDDLEPLLHYLHQLSPATVRRFQPHPFYRTELINFYQHHEHEAWVAVDPSSETIVAYTVLKKGYLHHDYPRLQQYGVDISYDDCYTIAPSVTDEWQSEGVGQLLFNYVLGEMNNDLGSSQYIYSYHGIKHSSCPHFEIDAEVKLHQVLHQIRDNNLAESMHDIADGGP